MAKAVSSEAFSFSLSHYFNSTGQSLFQAAGWNPGPLRNDPDPLLFFSGSGQNAWFDLIRL